MRYLFISIIVALLCSCGGGSSTSQPPIFASQPVDGTWRLAGGVIGSSTTLTLKENNTQVTGTGTYQMEAGSGGTITVTGTHTGASINLVLNYSNGNTITYAATLSDASHMTGTMTFQGGSDTSVFAKL